MHEGLTVDPKTGWDEGPRLSQWIPSVKVLTTAFAIVWLGVSFSPLAVFPWLMPTALSLFFGAVVLVLGLEARALAHCLGADTRASRQLR